MLCRGIHPNGFRSIGIGCRRWPALIINRRILLIELCEQRPDVACVDLDIRCRQDHAFAEGVELHDVAVPGVMQDRFPGMRRQGMVHIVLPVEVIEIKIQKVLDIAGAMLQLRDPQAQRAEGKEEVRAKQKLIPELGQIL